MSLSSFLTLPDKHIPDLFSDITVDKTWNVLYLNITSNHAYPSIHSITLVSFMTMLDIENTVATAAVWTSAVQST